MSTDLAYLMAVRLQGFTNADRISAATESDVGTVEQRLGDFVSAGLLSETKIGLKLTEGGVERLDELLAEENLRGSSGLLDAYERFLLVDPKVKKLSLDWNTNNDESLIYQLVDLHARASNTLTRIIKVAGRYAPYSSRLDGCIARLESGDHDAFTKAATESYHQIWWELHVDLKQTLGLEE